MSYRKCFVYKKVRIGMSKIKKGDIVSFGPGSKDDRWDTERLFVAKERAERIAPRTYAVDVDVIGTTKGRFSDKTGND